LDYNKARKKTNKKDEFEKIVKGKLCKKQKLSYEFDE
jgi:hypothetical protein